MSLAEQSQQWFPTSVQVTVLQARGLRIKGKNGTNDAYAIMQVAKDKFSTSVEEKSVAPVWKEEAAFDLPLFHPSNAERCTLQVCVMHRALMGPDKMLGQATINLLELQDNKSRNKTEWFKLMGKTGKADKDRGEVLLDIQFMKNNMTASMYDLSGQDKSRSRLGKLKDKLKGKKKDGMSDSASAIVPSVGQVLTDSEGEEEPDSTPGAKKKNKLKSLFKPKPGLHRNISQSMSTLTTLPEKDSAISLSRSSGLNVESPEGKKKFKFLKHKRTESSDSKVSQGTGSLGLGMVQSNVCINGSHVYTEEPESRGSRAGSTFSLNSSGHGSMEDLRRGHDRKTSSTSMDSLKTSDLQTQENAVEEMRRRQEEQKKQEEEVRKRLEEEQRRAEEEERKEEERKQIEDKKRLEREEERKRIEREEERKRIEREEERKQMEREEEKSKLEKREEERRRIEEEERERKRIEQEEMIRLKKEQERVRQEEERRKAEEERIKKEKRKRMEEEERTRLENEMLRKEEETKKIEMERRRAKEEERLQKEKEKEAEEKRKRIEEEERRLSEQKERKGQERLHLEKEKLELEKKKMEERMREEQVREKAEEEEEKRKLKEKADQDRIRQEKVEMERQKKEKEQQPEVKPRSARLNTSKKGPDEINSDTRNYIPSASPFEDLLSFDESSTNPTVSQPEALSRSTKVSAVKPSSSVSGIVFSQASMPNTNPFLDDSDVDSGNTEKVVHLRDTAERSNKKRGAPMPPQNKMGKTDVPPRAPAILEATQAFPSRGSEDDGDTDSCSLRRDKRPAPLPPKNKLEVQNEHADQSTTPHLTGELRTTRFQEKDQTNKVCPVLQDESRTSDAVNFGNTSLSNLSRGHPSNRQETNPFISTEVKTTKHSKGPAPKPLLQSKCCKTSASETEPNNLAISNIHLTEHETSAASNSCIDQIDESTDKLDDFLASVQPSTKPEPLHSDDLSSRELPAKSKLDSFGEDVPSRSDPVLGKVLCNANDPKNTENVLLESGVFKKKSRAPLPPAKSASGQQPEAALNSTSQPTIQDQDKSLTINSSKSTSCFTESLVNSSSTSSQVLTPLRMEAGHGSGHRSFPPVRVSPIDVQPVAGQKNGSESERTGDPAFKPCRPHAVKPLSTTDKQPDLRETQDGSRSAKITDDMQVKMKAPEAKGTGPYSQLTHEELINLLEKQKQQLSQKDAKIGELELYIDDLLVRVMEDSPNILMSLSSMKKSV
ncbi:rab11 family-interacting protein 1 isoform X1 [Sinocyclocheilus rhinocerous]|uniref:Rab11 family-interacting protein 1-like n=1 Tax=Sinocyclocheilus rhinocerous TaxID=307959 RepID=A0A673KXF6_9TELE|nr:PREDICTED: rab11 family-interacting protein 1-like isoform X1 [Sinocyclocheilus rhinocerous]